MFFLGGGGTELLSAQWSATSVASQRFQVPEYEVSVAGLPRGVRMKEFDFGLYELLPASTPAPGIWLDLDVGIRDETWGERPLALVVPRPGESVDEAEIKHLVCGYVERGLLPRYSVPNRVVAVEALVRTSVGKYDKKVLRQRYAG